MKIRKQREVPGPLIADNIDDTHREQKAAIKMAQNEANRSNSDRKSASSQRDHFQKGGQSNPSRLPQRGAQKQASNQQGVANEFSPLEEQEADRRTNSAGGSRPPPAEPQGSSVGEVHNEKNFGENEKEHFESKDDRRGAV